jgi:hypothetical protein
MATDYRIYAVQGNHIVAPALIIQCDCDETAIAKATAEFLEDHDLEIWDGARLVKRIASRPRPSGRLPPWLAVKKPQPR